MTDKTSVGVTVISHDSENRTLVIGYKPSGNYSRDIHYTGASLSQLASLTSVSSHCEQFIKYECITPCYSERADMLGGCNVILLR